MTKEIARQETQVLYPNIHKQGVVVLVTTQRGKSIYQHGERADGSKTKAVRVPTF